MGPEWTASQLAAIGGAEELEIAVRRGDGTVRPAVPIWVVTVAGEVYVRTWHRRGTGWFGRVLRSRRAQVKVPRLVADVSVEDAGTGPADLRAAVDAAFTTKYGRYGTGTISRMVSDDAAAATLRLRPERDESAR